MSDAGARKRSGVPDEVTFLRKWQIALQQIDDAIAWGVRRRVVLADAGYGDSSEFPEKKPWAGACIQRASPLRRA